MRKPVALRIKRHAIAAAQNHQGIDTCPYPACAHARKWRRAWYKAMGIGARYATIYKIRWPELVKIRGLWREKPQERSAPASPRRPPC